MIKSRNTNIFELGVYRVGEQSFHNKIEAFALSNRTGVPVTWHMFEDEIAAFDITQEPKETLTELYSERARQIRQDYDWIAIYF